MTPFDSNYGSILHRRFGHIWLRKMQWPWNPDPGSLKVTRNDTVRQNVYDLLWKFKQQQH